MRLEFSMRDALFGVARAVKSISVAGTPYAVSGTLRALQTEARAVGWLRRIPMLLTLEVAGRGELRTASFHALADAIIDGDRGAISSAYLVDAVGQDSPRSDAAVIHLGRPGKPDQALKVDGAWLPAVTP